MKDMKLDVLTTKPWHAQLEATAGPTKPSRQVKKNIAIKGVSSIQLAWWFQHIADGNDSYWKPLSPCNQSIRWVVSMEEAANHIGTLWESDQSTSKGLFPEDKKRIT
jgi:hypothetical protein